jgi:hypothetical protein
MEDNQQQHEQWAPPEHMHTAAMSARPKKKKLLWVVVGAVVIALVLAGAAYMLFGRSKTDGKKAATTTNQTTTQQTPATTQPAGDSSTPKTYKSTKLNIEFTYPGTWTMRENSDKSEVILTSPRTTYTKKGGVSTEGVFTVKLRHGLVPEIMKPTIEKAVAVKDSEVIAYTAPAAEQRQYTNMSFAGSGDSQNFFLVTGSIGFKAGDVFGTSFDTQGDVYLFAGGYGTDPNDSLSFDAVPKASFETPTYKAAKSIIESLKVY